MGERDAGRPIHSSRADDPALAEAIDAFAISLAQRVDHLQDAEAQGDLKALAAFARQLAQDAAGVGYEPLARRALEVEAAAAEEKAEDAHRSLVDLTEIARRVRLGHRGAF
jgi:hypothetical protein